MENRAAGVTFIVAAVIRCLTGYVLACIAAGLFQVAFVISPIDLLTADADRLTAVGIWLLLAVLHTGSFAAPFALIAIAVAEWKAITSRGYFAGIGIGIGIIAFLAQAPVRASDQPLKVTVYILAACIASGLVAGLVYWLVAGRLSGRRYRRFPRI